MRVAALAILAALAAGPAAAYCRLALTLAIDVSSSVNEDEYELQKRGLTTALTSPDVVDALFRIPGAWVALHVYEWSGRYQQDVVLDWVELRTPADLDAAVARIAAGSRTYAEFPTAMGYALAFGTFALRNAPECERKVIDVSGDGVNNDGFPPFMAARNHDFTDTTVNGLVIGEDPELMRYYRNYLIMGPGAFVEHARRFEDFGDAMERKLVRELGVPELGGIQSDRSNRVVAYTSGAPALSVSHWRSPPSIGTGADSGSVQATGSKP